MYSVPVHQDAYTVTHREQWEHREHQHRHRGWGLAILVPGTATALAEILKLGERELGAVVFGIVGDEPLTVEQLTASTKLIGHIACLRCCGSALKCRTGGIHC